MAKDQKKRGRGRPVTGSAMGAQINVRVEEDLRDGVTKYLDKYKPEYGWQNMADAVRHMMRRVLKEEGML